MASIRRGTLDVSDGDEAKQLDDPRRSFVSCAVVTLVVLGVMDNVDGIKIYHVWKRIGGEKRSKDFDNSHLFTKVSSLTGCLVIIRIILYRIILREMVSFFFEKKVICSDK